MSLRIPRRRIGQNTNLQINRLADRLLERQEEIRPRLGRIRYARRFDPNNLERAINDITGRVTSSASQRLAVAQGAGFDTGGLIVGGQRDNRDDRGTPGSQAPNTRGGTNNGAPNRPPDSGGGSGGNTRDRGTTNRGRIGGR
jgi:hypothetical protein